MTRYPPWPTAVLRGATEQEVADALRRLAELVGPLPAPDWLVPWGPDDPEGWEARVGFPVWSPRLQAAQGCWLAGESPAELRAREAGRLVEETLAGRFVRRTVDGVAAPPDTLRREAGDPVVAAVAAEVAAALSGAVLREHHPVLDRRAGRFGIELVLGDHLPESAFDELAAAVGRALERCGPPFADDGGWEASHGTLALTAWFDAPPADGLPPGGEDPGEPGALLGLDTLAALELRVVPERDAWATAAAVAAAAEAGLDVAPAPPAWVRGAQLPAWWTWSATSLPGGRVLAVPVPAFLAEDWADLDVRCWWAGGVGFVCAHDPVTRRDRWPAAVDRALDAAVWRPAAAAIGALGVRGLVRDGRDVVRWRFGAEGWTTGGLRRLLARCASVGPAEPWGLVGFSPDGVWVERTLTIP